MAIRLKFSPLVTSERRVRERFKHGIVPANKQCFQMMGNAQASCSSIMVATCVDDGWED